MKNVLVIGTSFGSLYKKVLEKNTNFSVSTLDTDKQKNPNFVDISEIKDFNYDMAIISTPNYLHLFYVREIFDKFKLKENFIFVVEKPGFSSTFQWSLFLSKLKRKNVKLLMTKNNLYRNQIPHLRNLFLTSKNDISSVDIIWNNLNRIPHPGSWFTERSKSFGGVSNDLLPHLLHFLISLYGQQFQQNSVKIIGKSKSKNYSLEFLRNSDYGSVDHSGIYDVDDTCFLNLKVGKIFFNFFTSWKISTGDDAHLSINFKNGEKVIYNFNLCPEYAYLKMILHFFSMEKNEYKFNNKIDLFVHTILDEFRK